MVRLWQDAAERYALAETAERSIAHLKGTAKSMEQLNTEIKAAEARLSEEEHKCQKLRERLQLMQTELLDVRGGLGGAWHVLSDPGSCIDSLCCCIPPLLRSWSAAP